jgi:hypothetical protein
MKPQSAIVLLFLSLLVVGCKTAPSPDSETSTIAPHLVKPLEFADFTVSSITSEGASNLMSQKIKAGSDDPDAYNFLTTNWDSARIRVETVNEYEAAIRAGYFPYNNFEIAMESYFKSASSTLTFMQQGRPSSHSFLSKHYLTELPVTVLYWTGDEQEKLQKDAGRGMTLKDYSRPFARRKLHEFQFEGNTMTFSEENLIYNVTELARGDFDLDGNEDALILIGTYLKTGSGRSYETLVVSRTDPRQRQLKLTRLK